MLRRDRNERYAFARMIASVVGEGLGVKPEALQSHLDLYMLELSQDVYRPAIHEALRHARTARRRKEQEERRMLEKVDRMTATDAEVPLPKATGQRRRPGKR